MAVIDNKKDSHQQLTIRNKFRISSGFIIFFSFVLLSTCLEKNVQFHSVDFSIKYIEASLTAYILTAFGAMMTTSAFCFFHSRGLQRRSKVVQRMLEHCTCALQDTAKKLDQMSKKISKLEREDKLTGIANRRRFDEFLDREWRLAVRMSHPVSLLMVDVDYLGGQKRQSKKVNEESLKQVAQALQHTVCRPGDLAGRYDGKEFAIVLAFTPLDAAMQVAEKLRSTIAEIETSSDNPSIFQHLSISIGIASTIPAIGSKPDELISKADRALNLAKNESLYAAPVLH